MSCTSYIDDFANNMRAKCITQPLSEQLQGLIEVEVVNGRGQTLFYGTDPETTTEPLWNQQAIYITRLTIIETGKTYESFFNLFEDEIEANTAYEISPPFSKLGRYNFELSPELTNFRGKVAFNYELPRVSTQAQDEGSTIEIRVEAIDGDILPGELNYSAVLPMGETESLPVKTYFRGVNDNFINLELTPGNYDVNGLGEFTKKGK